MCTVGEIEALLMAQEERIETFIKDEGNIQGNVLQCQKPSANVAKF